MGGGRRKKCLEIVAVDSPLQQIPPFNRFLSPAASPFPPPQYIDFDAGLLIDFRNCTGPSYKISYFSSQWWGVSLDLRSGEAVVEIVDLFLCAVAALGDKIIEVSEIY